MESEVFRNELKYLCNDAQMVLIENRINNLLTLDSHIKKGNSYRVRSLYLDDYDNTYFYDNQEGTNPREKMRIRTYNNNKDKIKLELKIKNTGKNLKKGTLIKEETVRQLINNKLEYKEEYSALIKKMYILNKTKLLKPKNIVEYDRTPYAYELGNVRITLDKNICSSSELENFFEDEYNFFFIIRKS